MSCCGKLRQQLGLAPDPMRHEPTDEGRRRSTPKFTIQFEYTGKTALTAIGAVSGRRYRFERTGARTVVDPRDRPSLVMVPNLRQVM